MDRHRVANRIAVENHGAVITDDTGQEFCNGLVGPSFADFYLASDCISGANRRLEFPLTCRKTVPGPGRSSATTALMIALVMPPWTTMPPKRVA